MFRYLVLCLQLVLLSKIRLLLALLAEPENHKVTMVDVQGSAQVNPRIKRALYGQQSSKLLVKHLALELAEKQNDGDNAKKSIGILQRDSCTDIKSIGKPITHNSRSSYYGAWMKDPLGIMGTETIFTMEGYYANVVEEFENMAKFKAGLPRKTYKLPYYWDGTGAVVYGKYLYYNRAGTNHIVKYELPAERVEVEITLSGYSSRSNYYRWGGYSGVDLAVDEQGLWVLWGSTSNSKRLYATQIDVYKNSLNHQWALSTETMNSMGNAFVACGVIYCIDEYSTNPTTINFAYDTKTGKQWNPKIHFTNQYRLNSMVDYNPREKVLYAWDRKRLVTYPITFE